MPDYVLKITSTADLAAVTRAIEAEQRLAGAAVQTGAAARDASGRFVAAGKEIEGAAKKAEDSWKGMGVAMAAGVGSFLGALASGVAQEALASIAAIPGKLIDATAEGVRFNASMESAKLSIAAIYRQFASGTFGNFDAALAGADRAIAALQAKADVTGATFKDLLGSYQQTVGSLYAAGITDLQKQVDTLGLLANAIAGVGVDKSQLIQETKAILTGNITADAQAAKTFGITSQDIEKAREMGKLYEFLEKKLGNFAEAGVRSGMTFNVAWDNAREAFAKFEGTVTKPIFDVLRESLVKFNEEIVNSGKLAAAASLGKRGVESGMGAVKPLLPYAGAAAAGLASAMPGGNLAMLGGEALSRVMARAGQAIDAEVKVQKALKETEAAQAKAGAAAEKTSEQLEKEGLAAQKLEAAVTKAAGALSGSIAAYQDAARSPEERLAANIARLQELRVALAQDFKKAGGTGPGLDQYQQPDDVAAQIRARGNGLSPEAKTAQLGQLKEIVDLMKTITGEAQKQSAEGGRAAKAESDKAEALAKTETERKSRVAEELADIRAQQAIERARITGNEALVKSLETEHRLRKEIVALDKIDPSGKLAAEAGITAELQKQVALKERQRSIDEVKAADAVDSARTPRQKRLAEEKLAEMRDRQELKDMAPDDLERQLKIRRDNRREAGRRPGQILGDARGDKPGSGLHTGGLEGGMGMRPDAEWSKMFPKPEMFGPPAPAGEMFGPPAPGFGPPPLGGDMFGPPAPQVDPAGGGAPPAGPGGDPGNKAAESLDKASEHAKEAADALDASAEKLEGKLGEVKTAVDNSAEKITGAVEKVLSAVRAAQSKYDALEGRVNALENK